MADITVGQGGWLLVRDPETGVKAYVRFDLTPDGRLRPGAMLAQAIEIEDGKIRGLRGADLRTFPLASVEAQANGELRDRILARIDNKLRVEFRQDDGSTKSRPVGTRVTITGDAAREQLAEALARPIEVPSTRPYPDEFYAEIAEAYTEIAATSQRPAADIADVADVPVRTVHRWVAEARKRGLLAPGRQGKVG